MRKHLKVIAELTSSPIGEGISLSKFVKKAVQAIDSFNDIRVLHHPMGTVVEADDLDTILKVAKAAHEAIFKAGAQRVITKITIDDRRDVSRVMEDKVQKVTE